MANYSATIDAKEMSYLYDLYFVPGWRELFDHLVDEEVKLPEEGKFLDASCGTGDYAIDLAARLSEKVQVVGIDDSAERLEIATGKAEIKKLDNIRFAQGTLENLGVAQADFDFVIADLSLIAPPELPDRLDDILQELKRVARPGATIVLKLATRGSFDEFYSIYWEALYEADLLDYTAQLEDLINERLTIEQLENAARDAGFLQVESLTEKQRFDFDSAESFFAAPLIEHAFLGHWLGILASESEEQQVREALTRIIDRERGDGEFDISAKTTLLIAKR
ncbi:MAG TPA: class I SAM-dependent methyltransferase [Blastocatellia bacterium]|nr:class I SAM-dependent methyltransferase [Blastocatellia bacterium]